MKPPLRLQVPGLLLGLAFAAHAPADCVGGVRQSTSAEIDFATRAVAALVAAIPATPQHMERSSPPHDFRQRAKPGDPCRDTPEGGFDVAYSVAYLFNWPRAEADRRGSERKKLTDEISALKTLPPDKAAQLKTLAEQSRAAYNSQPKAKRGGPPLTDDEKRLAAQKIAEGKSLDEQARAIEKAHVDSVKVQVDALAAKADALQTSPQRLQVRLAINARQLPAAAAEGGSAAFGAASPRGNVGLKVNNVVLEISGPPGVAKKTLFEAVDRGALQALVGKPLPAVVQSEAAAAALLAKGPAPLATP